ncbi:MAG: hypothetical protein J0H69_13500 [Burkholderiales bacterium]|jgi:hypothetical protein|nr:hypothetical protein [Burkholderiales bacterium]
MKRAQPSVPLTIEQAVGEAPTLARLAGLARESGDRLAAILPLVPAGLRPGLRPGPIEDGVWCLLVPSNAAAAKLRQLAPALQAHLRSGGWQVTSIRLKVQTA